MLKFLRIENFALIDHLEVEFEQGLNLITGETGSGKSILVDAVGLLVGERASQEMIRQGFDRARLDGAFRLHAQNPVRQELEKAGLEVNDEELIVRREICRSGSNKIFINGTLVTQSFLSRLGMWLADIHGQHDQQQLLHPQTQLEFLDAFGENQRDVQEVSGLFLQLKRVRRRLQEQRDSEQERLHRRDTLRFEIGDIERLELKPGLDQELQQERSLLTSAERRRQAAQESYQLLYERDNSLLTLLDQVQKKIQELVALDATFQPWVRRLREERYQMEEFSYQIRDYAANIESNAARLEAIEERLGEIHKASRKYGASVEEMLAYSTRIGHELAKLSVDEHRMTKLVEKEQGLLAEYLERAGQLSRKRHGDARMLCQRVEQELAELAMESAVFEVTFQSSETVPAGQGIDRVDFLISPNSGEVPRSLSKIASGGELSRIILGLKSILTLEGYPKTLVFDEVDAGIGGRVASRVGEKLARVATQHQVFCVTHLPQIACYATQHFHIDKHRRGDRTVIDAFPLQDSDRIEELARMLAGDAITETSRQHARELLAQRQLNP